MGLEGYRRKRKFSRTPEPGPSPGPSSGGLRFVVQKHYASHLHYDFRMEHEGVLKSWAVPKGPSMDPRDKRLAIQVEDHPYDYKDFQGRIPEGNYGAGLVEKWDEGTYSFDQELSRKEAEKHMAESLQKGHLDFVLHGKKLQGNFTLVRLKNKENQWLFIKRHEQGAFRPRRADEMDFSGAVKSPLPREVKPMLATLVDAPFDRENWAFEVKWDGYRSLAEVKKGKVRLYSRNGEPQNAKFPTVAAGLRSVPGTPSSTGKSWSLTTKAGPISRCCKTIFAPGKARSNITSLTSSMPEGMTCGCFRSGGAGPSWRGCCPFPGPCG